MSQNPSPSVPVGEVATKALLQAPGTSRVTPSTECREEVVSPPPVQAPSIRTVLSTMVTGAERERLMNCLNKFRRCNPWMFAGVMANHWIVEKWILHMEKLFHDIFVEE